VRHWLLHVPVGQPNPLQHSLDSAHAAPCDLHVVGSLHTWLMQESPEQQSPLAVQAWFAPAQVGSAMHVPPEHTLPVQHS
jgi:hypothetical protein